VSPQQDKLVVRQLDKKLAKFRPLLQLPVPRKGWISEMRRALGMSARQLGDRMGVSQAAVSQFESGEVSGTLTIATLEKAAAALDCELTYVLIPRRPLATVIGERARVVARSMLRRTAHSTTLERQGIAAAETKQQLDELTERLVRERPRALWDDVHDGR
jgi:predicted DNA-binding mobile mystery protein A